MKVKLKFIHNNNSKFTLNINVIELYPTPLCITAHMDLKLLVCQLQLQYL